MDERKVGCRGTIFIVTSYITYILYRAYIFLYIHMFIYIYNDLPKLELGRPFLEMSLAYYISTIGKKLFLRLYTSV
jgi:hypothetical protein